MRIVLAVALAFFSFAVHAQWGGALQGLGEGLQRWAEMEQQRQQMRQQHEFEMQRIEREHELRMQQLDREDQRRRELQRAEHERQARAEQQAGASERHKVEAAHPGWLQTVRSDDFRQWMGRQPGSVQNLAASPRADDAILLIDLYKRDKNQ
jgi:hypothetical protein